MQNQRLCYLYRWHRRWFCRQWRKTKMASFHSMVKVVSSHIKELTSMLGLMLLLCPKSPRYSPSSALSSESDTSTSCSSSVAWLVQFCSLHISVHLTCDASTIWKFAWTWTFAGEQLQHNIWCGSATHPLSCQLPIFICSPTKSLGLRQTAGSVNVSSRSQPDSLLGQHARTGSLCKVAVGFIQLHHVWHRRAACSLQWSE